MQFSCWNIVLQLQTRCPRTCRMLKELGLIPPFNPTLGISDQKRVKMLNKMSQYAPLFMILSHPKIPWNWTIVSARMDIAMSIILNYAQLPWDLYAVQWDTAMRYGVDINNPNLPFVLQHIARRSDITTEIICHHYKLPWDYRYTDWCGMPLYRVANCVFERRRRLSYPKDSPFTYVLPHKMKPVNFNAANNVLTRLQLAC
jgi:hypothetical protein